MSTKVLTAHVPLPLAKKVDKLAGRMERSRGWIVKEALTDWIEREERRHKMTLEALADVDAWNVHEQSVVEAWAKSLGSKKAVAVTHAPGAEMRVVWTTAGLRDLNRLYAFLVPKSEPAAADVIQSLTAASRRLSDYPRLGPKLSAYETRESRHIIMGDYDLRYEILGEIILILRVWHGRENR